MMAWLFMQTNIQLQCSGRTVKTVKGSLCVLEFRFFFCYQLPLLIQEVFGKQVCIPHSIKGRKKEFKLLANDWNSLVYTLHFKLLMPRFIFFLLFFLMYDFSLLSNLVFRALGRLRSIAWMHSNYKVKRTDTEILSMLFTFFSRQ